MLVSDPLLSGFTHILIDEVHERTIESDFLLLLVKKLIIKRPSLRVVLMSATADARHFVDYFESALETVPVVDIPGKLFPVKQVYLHEIIELTDYKLKYDSEYRMKDNQIHQKLANVKVSEKRGRSQTLKYEWNEATKFVNESIEPSEIVTSI
jgi:ATP-dependent RNA helicase DHX29